MSSETLRVAFIGAGGIAGTHMRYFSAMHDVEIVAASDVVEDAVNRRCAEFNIPGKYTDAQQMLDEIKPDAVSVCTPNGLHAEWDRCRSRRGRTRAC